MLRLNGRRIESGYDDVDSFQRFVEIQLGAIVDSDDLCAVFIEVFSSGRVEGMTPCKDPDLVSFGQERFSDVVAEASRGELSTSHAASDREHSLSRSDSLGRHLDCVVVVKFGQLIGEVGQTLFWGLRADDLVSTFFQ